MVDRNTGWAWASGISLGNSLFYTLDGGLNWTNRTPQGIPCTFRTSFFLNSKAAWVFIVSQDSGAVSLLCTTNSGDSWRMVADSSSQLMGILDCRFADNSVGFARVGDFGLGNAYYSFYKTEDGGKSWNLLMPKRPKSSKWITPNGFHLPNFFGDDVTFYGDSRVIVTTGDLPEGPPGGSVHLSTSTNRCETWRDLKLPLPAVFQSGLVMPSPAIFVDQFKGLLPVYITETRKGTFGHVLFFFLTDDGGATWLARPGIVRFKEPWSGPSSKALHMVSWKDVFVRDSNSLYVSHDAAGSWQIISPKIDFGTRKVSQNIAQINFVDATTGWLIAREDHRSSLYSTSDGGTNWIRLRYKLSR